VICHDRPHEPLSFWRDHIGSEVDVIVERGSEVAAVEIKSGVTVAPDALGGLHRWQRYAAERGLYSAIHAGWSTAAPSASRATGST